MLALFSSSKLDNFAARFNTGTSEAAWTIAKAMRSESAVKRNEGGRIAMIGEELERGEEKCGWVWESRSKEGAARRRTLPAVI